MTPTTFSLRLTLGALLLAAAPGCRDAGPAPLPLTIDAATELDAARLQTQAHLRTLDVDDRLRLDDTRGPHLRLVYDAAVTAEGYRLLGASPVWTVTASDTLGARYGLYDLIERLGALLPHPEQLLLPDRWCLECVGQFDESHAPGYTMRGTHIHTMHPIDYESTLLGNDDTLLPRFERLLDWLVARRQNYLEWNLLRTVDFPAWIDYASRLVELAHARGMRIGIVAPLAFRQQNSYYLIDLESPTPHTEQISRNLDALMVAGWDAVNVEMGASEFFPVSDTDQVAWLNYLADDLDARYPGTKTATKVHVSTGQLAPSFGDINFNFIPQFADANVGIMPHTVQFYDLYRVAPTYGNEDFSAMREFLLQEIGKRDVFYYPETAYFVTFDIDVPIFLPQYAWSRWNDLHRLRDSGMDGQINFSSGFEWGYWFNDFAASWFAYAPADDFAVVVDRITAGYGDAAAEASALLLAHIDWQGRELLEANGVRWLIGWDAADDLGYFADIFAQPVRPRLFELAEADAARLDEVASELTQLDAMIDELRGFADAWGALDSRVARAAWPIYEEFRLGAEINWQRAVYVRDLYRATFARRRAELGLAADGDVAYADAMVAARNGIDAGLAIVAQQEPLYRFPHAEIAVDRLSYTSYPFGYLRTVTDLYYWEREYRMVEDPKGFNFVEALYDLIESGGF